jgi:hypothetical protein
MKQEHFKAQRSGTPPTQKHFQVFKEMVKQQMQISGQHHALQLFYHCTKCY